MNISLIDVTKDNYQEVMALEVEEIQRKYVAPNSESIADSKFNPYCCPRAICLDGEIVGFAMYERCVNEGKPNEFNLYRMMVDRAYQKMGVGSAAMPLLLNEIKQHAACRVITVCYEQESEPHRLFYQRAGFREVGYSEEYQEMLAEIVVRRVV